MPSKRKNHINLLPFFVSLLAWPKGASADNIFKFLTTGVPDKEILFEIVAVVIKTLTSIAGVIVAIFIVISGIRFISSAGNPKQIEAAKSALTASVIGLIIILLSRVIIITFIKTFGGNISGL
jgi:hypothetical protein